MGQNLTPNVKILLLINLLIFGAVNLIHSIDVVALLGYHYPKSEYFQVFQPFTYMFVHRDFAHIFSNMFALFIFGPMLENVLGSKRFLILYLVTGLGGGALYGLVNFVEIHQMEASAAQFILSSTPENFLAFCQDHAEVYLQHNTTLYNFAESIFPADPNNPGLQKEAVEFARKITIDRMNIPMIGASGAIFGILFTFAYLFPNLRLMLLFPPIPIKAKYLVGAYILYETYELINQNPADNVAHLAHLGGALFAYLLMRHWKYQSYQN
ncbi:MULTISPECIES: rhomboid family intramembrane serine protease [Flammeovirga]|uniref:Rhomboid family intramembrane serine protease n=1 Tax=Flammeovirga agarivorans TaxID=2726742 RepID=A0A7X8SJG1_9BACT|nr:MULTISPECIES: rhomboid family intramembrane serine protease [Flammeovirga]NLR91349.1 rhomboid family intramembrane serine protease [Flammeovirga agarivorans]